MTRMPQSVGRHEQHTLDTLGSLPWTLSGGVERVELRSVVVRDRRFRPDSSHSTGRSMYAPHERRTLTPLPPSRTTPGNRWYGYRPSPACPARRTP